MPAPAKHKPAARDTKQRPSPVASAVEALSKAAQAGVRPDRIENQVARIMDEWVATMDPDEVGEKLTELRESMTAGADGFEAELQDAGVDIARMGKAEKRVLDALRACNAALERQRLPEAA